MTMLQERQLEPMNASLVLDRRALMFAVVGVDRPIEQVVNDWDFLDEKLVKKFTTWQEVGGNIIGIRRREITLKEIVDPKKGKFNSITMTPDGLISKNTKRSRSTSRRAACRTASSTASGSGTSTTWTSSILPIPPRAGRGAWALHRRDAERRPRTKARASPSTASVCLTMLHEHYYATGRDGLHGIFWHAEEDRGRVVQRRSEERAAVPSAATTTRSATAGTLPKTHPNRPRRGASGDRTRTLPAYDIYLGEGDGSWQEASRYQVWTTAYPLDRTAAERARTPRRQRAARSRPRSRDASHSRRERPIISSTSSASGARPAPTRSSFAPRSRATRTTR